MLVNTVNECNQIIYKRLEKQIKTRVFSKIKEALKLYETPEQLLGCTMQQYKQYVEKQFEDGMTWQNQARWQIDHIIPLNSFNLLDPLQRQQAFNYQNTRPLWSEVNLSRPRLIRSPTLRSSSPPSDAASSSSAMMPVASQDQEATQAAQAAQHLLELAAAATTSRSPVLQIKKEKPVVLKTENHASTISVQDFIRLRCQVSVGNLESLKGIYKLYERWCREQPQPIVIAEWPKFLKLMRSFARMKRVNGQLFYADMAVVG
jgi:hypothetical protein